jgi:hypothetical protein
VDADRESTAEPEQGVVTIRLSGLEDVVPQFANVVHANNDREIFQLIFSQVTPPILLSAEDAEELARRGTISGRIIARIILTPTILEQTIDVLQTQLRRYRDTQDQIETGAVESTSG